MEDPSKTRLPSIASLMTPLESKPLEPFRQTPTKSPPRSHKGEYSPKISMLPRRHLSSEFGRTLPSPPISPHQEKQYKHENGHQRKSSDLKDPFLFAESEAGSNLEEPLFPPERAVNTEELISRHMAMHMTQFKNKLNQPTRDDYRLALACIPTIGAHYNRDPAAYMKRQREEQENEYWQAKRICARPGTKAAPVAIAPAPKAGKRAIRPPTPKPAIQRFKRTTKQSPIAKLMNFPPKGRSATPDCKGPVVKRDDVDFSALPDFTPPLDTLPNNPTIFKPEWPSSNMLDLSNDPHRHLLHEAEVHLAAKLRLSCAKYLCCKRRLFEARLNALRIGKEFRKTDAQQSCAVDVNKASRLWTAYDRVGWLNKTHVEQFL